MTDAKHASPDELRLFSSSEVLRPAMNANLEDSAPASSDKHGRDDNSVLAAGVSSKTSSPEAGEPDRDFSQSGATLISAPVGRRRASVSGSGSGAGGERAARTRGSMLWAAYGDALGFISEMVDRRGLERRTRGEPLERLMGWKRRVGGRHGVEVELPAGCWSDDTQLRMAVSRSVGARGFDVETFARCELPVWPSYALGGGRASKAAARNLGKPRTLWYANQFPGWSDAGGNGTAMRIHPHVWASKDLDSDFMLDVVEDSVCTHGHPRAIVGACFHAAALAHCMKFGTVPDTDTCVDIAARVGDAIRLIEEHSTLGPVWSGLWERETGKRFNDAWRITVKELHRAIRHAADGAEATNSDDATYDGIVDRLGLRDRAQQGSGILTTVAAVVLAATASDAHGGVVAAANAIGTDTDTIATMAGALLGACDTAADPPEDPLDSAYLRAEADRLLAVARGEQAHGHLYPDILTWSAPQTQADALVSDNGSLVVEGLGAVTRLEADTMYTARQDFAWEWVRTDFGQTLLIKRRPEIKPLKSGNDRQPPPAPPSDSRSFSGRNSRSKALDGPLDKPRDRGVNLNGALDHARRHLNDDTALGYTLRRVAREGTRGDLLNFAKDIWEDLRR